jgi:hypothetical protein
MKGKRLLFVALIFSLLLHLPTLTGFFTNDDFFHFQISQASNLGEFIKFFDPLHQPQGYGWYRPIANQLYYFIGIKAFSLDPFPMRLLLLGNYLINIFLVWYVILELSKSDLISGIAACLYSASAALFAGIYLVGVQERPLTLFFLLSVILFIRFVKYQKTIFYIGSFLSFILAILSKESAVVMPLIFLYIVWFLAPYGRKITPGKSFVYILPLILIDLAILFFKFYSFGFAQGDSYVWQLSPRIINTFAWYSLWSVNIPEMFVDYIGPGLHINPNLIKYWGTETMMVIILFTAVIMSLVITAWKNRHTFTAADKKLIVLGVVWFITSISPVLGLPLHKFPHYLSIPLAGTAMTLAVIISRSLTFRAVKRFLMAFFLLYLINFSISARTHWAYTGQLTARRVHEYVQSYLKRWSLPVTLVFYDTPKDTKLPWLPSATLKTVLSDNSYFQLFYPERISAVYLTQKPDKIIPGQVLIEARQFLGY